MFCVLNVMDPPSWNQQQHGGGGGGGGDLYEAMEDFPPQQDGDLGLRQGDIVLVSDKSSNWWTGRLRDGDGRSGTFPSQIVRELPSPPQDNRGPPPQGDSYRDDPYQKGPPPHGDSYRSGGPPQGDSYRDDPYQKGPPSHGDSYRSDRPPQGDSYRDDPYQKGPPPHGDSYRSGGGPPQDDRGGSWDGRGPQQGGRDFRGHPDGDLANQMDSMHLNQQQSPSAPPFDPNAPYAQPRGPSNEPPPPFSPEHDPSRPVGFDDRDRGRPQQGYPPSNDRYSDDRGRPQQGYPPNDRYSDERGRPQQGYPPNDRYSDDRGRPQQGYPPNDRYSDDRGRPQQGYPPNDRYSDDRGRPQQGYPPNDRYDDRGRPQQGYPPNDRYSDDRGRPQQGYPPNDRYSDDRGRPQQGYPPNDRYDDRGRPQQGYPPNDRYSDDRGRPQQGYPPNDRYSDDRGRPQQGYPPNDRYSDDRGRPQQGYPPNDRYSDDRGRPQQGYPPNDRYSDDRGRSQQGYPPNDRYSNDRGRPQQGYPPNDPRDSYERPQPPPPSYNNRGAPPPRGPTEGLQPTYPSAPLGSVLEETIRDNQDAMRGWDKNILAFSKLLNSLPEDRVSTKGVIKLRDFENSVVDDLIMNGGTLSYRNLENIKKADSFMRSRNERVLFEEGSQNLRSIPNDRLYHPSFNGLTFDFLKFDECATDQRKNVFRLTDEARNFLRSVKMPVAAITVVGRYRSGKSYLLNNLAGLECRAKHLLPRDLHPCHNFSVSQVDAGETTGMRAYPLFLPPGTKLPDQWPARLSRHGACLLLVDSQGFEDVQVPGGANRDAKILSVALLISSLLIVNVMTSGGAIMRDDLENLGMVTQVTNEMAVGDIPKGSDLSSKELLHNVFPDLLWLARNVNIHFEEEPTTYFRNILNQTDGGLKLNTQRRAIQESFNNIQMFPLSDPAINSLPGDPLAPETWGDQFQGEFHSLITRILSMVKLKRHYSPQEGLGEEICSGEDFLDLVEGVIETSNASEMPDFTRSLEKLQDHHRAKLATESERIFNGEMDKIEKALDEGEFQEEINKALSKALTIYDGKFKDKYRGAAEERLGVTEGDGPAPNDSRIGHYTELNNKRARIHNQHLLRDLFSPMEDKILAGNYTPEQFTREAGTAAQRFHMQAKGNSDVIDEMLESFQRDTVAKNQKILELMSGSGGKLVRQDMSGMARMYRRDREMKKRVKVERLRYHQAQKRNIKLQISSQQSAFEKRSAKRSEFTGLSSRDIESEERAQRARKEQQIAHQMAEDSKRRAAELEAQNRELQANLIRMQNAEAAQRQAYMRQYEMECERKGRAPERMPPRGDPRYPPRGGGSRDPYGYGAPPPSKSKSKSKVKSSSSKSDFLDAAPEMVDEDACSIM